MTDYRSILPIVCNPQATANLKKSLLEKQQELLIIYLANQEDFSILADNRSGQFIGDFLQRDVESLLNESEEYFDHISNLCGDYTVLLGKIIDDDKKDEKPHLITIFNLMRGSIFGSKLALYILGFKLYRERVNAWNNYWKHEME